MIKGVGRKGSENIVGSRIDLRRMSIQGVRKEVKAERRKRKIHVRICMMRSSGRIEATMLSNPA